MSAIAPVQTTVEEYLHTSYEPECEYIDGELQETNVGELDHSRVQMAIAAWFFQHQKDWNLEVLPAVRVQASARRFRVPDLALLPAGNEESRIVRQPPLVVIEILSPEDRVVRYEERIADFKKMGVRHIWVIDPETKKGFDCSTGSWIETATFSVPNTPIVLDLPLIFSQLP
jgi:Uma2 family endonuclease